MCSVGTRKYELVNCRRGIFARYSELLSGVSGVGLQPVAKWAEISPWLYCITVDEKNYGHTRDELMSYLLQNGVETRPFFIPVHTLPPFCTSRISPDGLSVTKRLGRQGFIICPLFQD